MPAQLLLPADDVVAGGQRRTAVGTAHALDMGQPRHRAGGGQHRVESGLGQLLRCGRVVELHSHAVLFQLADQPQAVVVEGPLEGEMIRMVELPAQIAGLLVEGHGVAPLRRGDGRLHTGRAASDDCHLLLFPHRLHHMGCLQLHAKFRVD